MANNVSEITISRYEYTVITEKWYVEIQPGSGKFRDELIDYFYVYIQRGNTGVKRFVYGCPKVDQTTGEVLSADDVVRKAESFLVGEIASYMEEEEALSAYYADKYGD